MITAAAGDIAVMSVMAAGLGDVSLEATTGAITDATADETTANITSDRTTLIAQTGIGAAGDGDIDTALTTLTATNNASGGIVITDVDDLGLNEVTAPGQEVELTAGGAITDASNGSEAANITGDNVILTAETGIGGTGVADLNTKIATLTATNNVSGGIGGTDADNLGLNVITALGQTVTLTAGGAIADASNGSETANIFADRATLMAINGIGAYETDGKIGDLDLDTEIITLTATNNGTGSIVIDETDGLTLQNVTASGDIHITAENGNIVLNDNGQINAANGGSGGGVLLHAKTGTITLNNGVSITGYSKEGAAGVNLPGKDADDPSKDYEAAIVLISNQTLRLGNSVTLEAKGEYKGNSLDSDGRSGAFFEMDGNPVDVGIYIVSKNGNVDVVGDWSDTTSKIVIARGKDDFGTVVFDAHDQITFSDEFESYLKGGALAHLELCSRDAGHTLQDAALRGLLPYADSIANVTWFSQGCVLRGGLKRYFDSHESDSSNPIGRAVVLATSPTARVAPYPMPIIVDPIIAVESPVTLTNLPPERRLYLDRDYYSDYVIDLKPDKSFMKLNELDIILKNYSTAVNQLLNVAHEVVPSPSAILTDEQVTNARNASKRFEGDTKFIEAQKWMDAIALFQQILTDTTIGDYTEMGLSTDDARDLVGQYQSAAVSEIEENTQMVIDVIISAYLESKGG
jgi:hypothetical protein